MPIGYRLKSLTFSGAPDAPVDVADNSLIVVIGPNNAGKSQALRDGANWDEFQGEWRRVAAAVDQMPTDSPTIESVRRHVDEVLGQDATAHLREEQTRRIREITKSRDGWKRMRESGLTSLPNGEIRATIDNLLAHLQGIGLFVVPVGALEGWAPQIGGHGPRFLDEALTAGVHEQSDDLRSFTEAAASFLETPSVED